MLWINSHLRLQPAGPGVVVVVPRVVSHLGDAELVLLHLYSLKSRAEKKWFLSLALEFPRNKSS